MIMRLFIVINMYLKGSFSLFYFYNYEIIYRY